MLTLRQYKKMLKKNKDMMDWLDLISSKFQYSKAEQSEE